MLCISADFSFSSSGYPIIQRLYLGKSALLLKWRHLLRRLINLQALQDIHIQCELDFPSTYYLSGRGIQKRSLGTGTLGMEYSPGGWLPQVDRVRVEKGLANSLPHLQGIMKLYIVILDMTTLSACSSYLKRKSENFNIRDQKMNLLFVPLVLTQVQITFLCDGELARQISFGIFLANPQSS